MPDQVPFRYVAADLNYFRLSFLNLVLAKNSGACCQSRAQDLYRMGLAYGDQFYVVGISADTLCRLFNSFKNLIEIPLQTFLHALKYTKSPLLS
jgi:hypothetical protein